MISNPYLPMPSRAAAWAEGFVKGFAGPQYSSEPPSNIAEEDASAYSEGMLVGQQGAVDGLVFTDPCVVAGEGEDTPLDDGLLVFDAGHTVFAFTEKLGMGLASVAVTLIELACSLPVHTLPPEQVLPDLGKPLADSLSAMGVGSLELFCSVGVDASVHDCELKLSPLFKSQDAARQAAQAMGRPEYLIASWRTDQSRSFHIVDSF